MGYGCKVADLFDLSHTMAETFLASFEYPWQALGGLKNYITLLGGSLGKDFIAVADGVWVHKSATVAPSAYICAPTVICAGAEVRHGAYVRGGALIGEGCVVGNSSELKNCILFDGVCTPHFNYVGDSVLGFKAHMGAGAVTSNVKSDRSPVTVDFGGEKIATGLKKAGAFLGDFVEVGCNAVLNPGTVIGKNTSVYPLTGARGVYPPQSIVKSTHGVFPKI